MGRRVVVIGAGAAGMEAAGQLAKAGCSVTLVEKEEETGGNVRNWYHLFPDHRDSKEVISYLDSRVAHKNLTLITGTTVEDMEQDHGQFILKTGDGMALEADAVVVSTGFDLFRSERKEEYGYGIYDNVISSADLEKMFRKGEVLRHDGEIPRRIGLVHCVGSRDEKVGNPYCSKLCCVTAVKQAMELKKKLNTARVFCFYMDMRMGGALYEELYRESQEKYGINYIRGKVSEVSENFDNRLVVKVEDTLAGRPLKMELDMLVLMAGMEMSESGARLARAAGLKTGENKFFAIADHHFGSNKSELNGIFYAGTCTMPMNITETISHARAAVADVLDYLNTLSG
ncbi:MAG: CoB--CoM heterodisulfide reductase iron-sulfur subunit A family protein [Bacteroidales bacterium]|nr:CoB--CoM heterodisulfide reductase iron-sulfur subunit A family protein [Bacteroidales bacterium]MBN2632105.1 CoB--CoM heterodisulfide reductase iron-sulfur subunit A family protein [Bacteroidales bacterium]